MIVNRGLAVKVILICLASTPLATSFSEQSTRLISVDYNSYNQPTIDSNENESLSISDISAQESTNIENRKLYQTVKHASGYDPDIRNTTNDINSGKHNSTALHASNPLRKSAVIQSIPRKVRGPITVTSSTTTSSPFVRPSIHTAAKDYGTGEPTTTIVYATSIPTTPSKTYVNIRPAPLLPTQKYRSTILEGVKNEKSRTAEAIKPVIEETQPQEQDTKPHQSNVLEKPTFKINSNTEQASTTPRSYETTPYLIEQRKRNLIKSIPYARIRTNDDIDEMSTYNRNAFVNPYPNHKWTNEDYMPKMYDNRRQQNNHQPPNYYESQYDPTDNYPDAVYRNVPTPSPVYVPQQQPVPNFNSQQSRQNFQPLTVRDFDLLLQLLVLRERRLHASQQSYPYHNDYVNGAGISQQSNYYYDMPNQPMPENPYLKNREPKYNENFMPRAGQLSSTRLLPSNVREELLFRMLLLALHLQPQPKPISMATNSLILPPPYMYLNTHAASSTSPQSPEAGFLGFSTRNAVPKSPVRSVQILGEID